MSDNIKVAIKVRPLIKREKDEQAKIQWAVKDNTIKKIGKTDSEYQFDHIFDSGQTNNDVFLETTKPIVEAAMKGFNGTIFAYGQTSSGKTYTMMGSENEPGVIPLSVNRIFDFIENDLVRVYLLRVSYLEIYNEKIHDLLRKDLNKDNDGLKIKEDHHGNVTVDCTAIVANSAKEVLRTMKIGDKARRVGDTNMNERSSRSHTIFRIEIESCEKNDPEGTTVTAQLNLIDLAGSERPKTTGATGERFNEGRHINSSLSTLSLVIKQLSENSNGHINFRDSKLTRILQTSLGGNAMTTIICAVTPAADEETECTLAFAQRAKGIKNKPKVNETVSEQVLIKKMLKQVNNLTAQIDQLDLKLQEKDKQILWGRIELLTTKMLSGSGKEQNQRQSHDKRRRTWGGPGMNVLPPSATSFGFRLPTIIESDHISKRDHRNNDEDEKKKYAKRRQSVIQKIDSTDSTFQTDIPDFELELIRAEKERLNRHSNGSIDNEFDSYDSARKKIQFDNEDDVQEFDTSCSTPEKQNRRDRSPGTPKIVLRNKIESLESNYNDLRTFTTLEKQILQEDVQAATKYHQYEKNMAFLQKSLADSEQLCRDANKKYAELQSEFTILSGKHESSTRQCESLTQQVDSLLEIRDSYVVVESERSELKTKWIKATKRIEELEGESSSNLFELDHLKDKFKSRVQELEGSLNSAWDELKNITGLDQEERKALVNKEVAQLQSIVDNLNIKITSSSEETISLNAKIQDLEQELEKLQGDNSSLNKQLEEFVQRQEQIEDLSKKINELEDIIVEKDNQIQGFESSKVDADLLSQQIQDLKNNEEEYLQKINKLEILIAEKENQITKTLEESSLIQEEYVKKISDLEGVIAENNGQINNLETVKLEVDSLSKELEDSKINLSTIHSEYSEKIKQLEILIGEKENQITKTLEESNLQVDSMTKKLEQLTADHSLVEEEYVKKLVGLEEVIAEKDSQINNLETTKLEVDSLSKELEDSKINLSKIHEEYSKKIIHLEEIIAENTSKLNENSELTSKCLETENKLKTSNELIDKLKLDIDEMQLNLNQKSNEFLDMKSRFEELTNLGEQQNNEDISNLRVELSSLQKSMSIKNNEIEVATTEINTQEAEILRLNQMINEINELHKHDIFDTKEKIITLETEISERNDAVKSLEKLIEEKKNELGMTIENFESKINCLQNENEELKKELNDVVLVMEENNEKLMTIPKIEDQLNKICLEKEELMKELTQLQENLEQTQALLKDATDKNMNMSSRVEEIEKSLTESNEKSSKTLNDSQLNSSCQNNNVPSENDVSSIFANGSYFDNMDVSIAPGDEVFNSSVLSNKSCHENGVNNSDNKENEDKNETTLMENSMKNLSVFTEVVLNNDLSKLKKKSTEELEMIISDFVNVKTTLEEENAKLEENLQAKIRETEELKNDFKDFKFDMESLQQTVQLLSTENAELAAKLSQEKEALNDMKLKLENEIEKSNEVTANDEIKSQEDRSEALIELKKQVEDLTKENNEIFTTLTEKNQELVDMKEQLKAEATKNKNLTDENIELSNSLMDKIEEYDAIIEKYKSENQSKSQINNQNSSADSEINMLKTKIQVLKSLNSKLIEEKLTSCSECIHLVEKNEFRKMLKNDVKAVTIKLNDLQKKFDQESAEAEILRSKVNEDSNKSIFHESILNTSILEGVDLSCAEEKIHLLQVELENVQHNYEKLESRYQEQNNEIERLRDTSISPDNLTSDNSCSLDESKSSKREEQLSRLEKFLKKERSDVINLKNKIESVSKALEKLKLNKLSDEAELESLKSSNKLTEEKLSDTQTQMDKLKTQLNNLNEEIQVSKKENEEIKNINSTLDLEIVDLKQALNDTKEKREELIKEFDLFKSTPPPERAEIASLNIVIEEYKENTKKLEIAVIDLKNKLEYYSKENLDLQNEITELQKEKVNSGTVNLNETNNQMEICDNYEPVINGHSQEEMIKALEELETARLTIKKEIASLKQSQELKNNAEFADKTVAELVQIFITEIMSKEQEIIKKLLRDHEKEKRKLVESLKESEGSKLRLTNWSKELEADVERLQTQLSSHEEKTSSFMKKIADLENLLKECEHEKSLTNEKMAVMETDFNALQIDYEKLTKGEVTSAIQTSQNIDKHIEKAIETCQAEHRDKINKIDKEYKSKIDELTNSLEYLKTKNIELQSNLDCHEANERQLKSIVDLKTSEHSKLTSNYEILEKELKQLNEVYTQITQEHSQKTEKLDEITSLLKKKCDKLSEYKTKLESINPDYEILKEQCEEREIRLEKYKTEASALRDENSKQITLLRDFSDKLEVEKIKSAGLNKQLADITNDNIVIQSELEKIKEKCEEFEAENQRLLRRMRNSTDKETAKKQTADLIDENRVLQQNLNGASNRIAELQNTKSELLKVKSEVETKYENLSQEYDKLNNTFLNYKKKTELRRLDISFDEKYDNLIQEKNIIALELEDKKSKCLQYENKIKQLELKNKELDDEMDDIVKKIEETETEKDEIGLELFDLKAAIEQERAACQCKNRNNNVIDPINSSKSINGQVNNSFKISRRSSDLLRRELKESLSDFSREPKSTSSSRSSSPTPLSSKRKQRRSDLFNQNRPNSLKEELTVSEDIPISPCQCEDFKKESDLLRQQIIKLEQSSALKSNQVKSLQLQLEAQTFPYKKKCQEYQDIITAYKKENTQLCNEILKLSKCQVAIDCQRCKNWMQNKKDQAVQCMPMRETISMLSRPSGIVEQQLEVEKLKADKSELKKLCLSRRNQVVELKAKIDEQDKELEKLRGEIAVKYPVLPIFKNPSSESKENVSSNIMGQVEMPTRHRYWFDK